MLDGNLQRMIRWIVKFSGLSVFPLELADAGQDRERATLQLDGLVAAGVLIKVKDCYQVAGKQQLDYLKKTFCKPKPWWPGAEDKRFAAEVLQTVDEHNSGLPKSELYALHGGEWADFHSVSITRPGYYLSDDRSRWADLGEDRLGKLLEILVERELIVIREDNEGEHLVVHIHPENWEAVRSMIMEQDSEEN